MIDRYRCYVLKKQWLQNNICNDGLKLMNNSCLRFIYNSYTVVRTCSLFGVKKLAKCSLSILYRCYCPWSAKECCIAVL